MAEKIPTKGKLTVEFIKDFSSFISYMPNPDEVVQRTGEGLGLYDEMLTDGRVGSLFYTRRNATMNLPVFLNKTGNSKIDNFADEFLEVKQLRKWGWLLLTGALTYGHRPEELVWKREKGYLLIDYLKGYNINNYSYDTKGNLYYSDSSGRRLLNQNYKWIIHRHEGDTHNKPNDVSILKSAYWAYKFKQLGFQFWLTATEKFSVPSIIALFEDSGDPTKTQERADSLAGILQEIESGSGGSLANVKDIKTIEMSGALRDFDVLIQACDVQIAYALTGQSLATNNPDSGSRALGSVHADTMQGFVENDARALAYTLQELVEMIITLNFGEGSVVPIVEIDTGDYASWEMVSAAIEKGIPVSKSKLYSRYRLPEPEDDTDVFAKPESQIIPGTGENDFSDPEGVKKTSLIIMNPSEKKKRRTQKSWTL